MSRGWLYGVTAAFCILVLGGALLLNWQQSSGLDRRTIIGADEQDLCRDVQVLFDAEKFDELDRMGRQFATLKDRFEGGGEKLSLFYESMGLDGCGTTFCEARPVQPQNIRKLQNWLNRDPKNSVAKTAMALNWYYFAWVGRGCAAWADITFDQWQLYFDRLRIARSYLDGVDPHTSPQYYAILMDILCESGGPRERLDALYEQGHTAFPNFYGLTMRYARVLDRNWYGRGGDLAWLAETLLDDPGGDSGKASYSFVAELSSGLVGTEGFFPETGLSWDNIKQGFAVRQQLYGLTNHDWNAYCYMAYAAGDRDACREAYAHFGENVDATVWQDRSFYPERVLPWIKGQ